MNGTHTPSLGLRARTHSFSNKTGGGRAHIEHGGLRSTNCISSRTRPFHSRIPHSSASALSPLPVTEKRGLGISFEGGVLSCALHCYTEYRVRYYTRKGRLTAGPVHIDECFFPNFLISLFFSLADVCLGCTVAGYGFCGYLGVSYYVSMHYLVCLVARSVELPLREAVADDSKIRLGL